MANILFVSRDSFILNGKDITDDLVNGDVVTIVPQGVKDMEKYYEKDYWNNDVIKYVYEKWEKFWCDTKKFKDKQSRFLVEQFLDDLIALDEDIYTD